MIVADASLIVDAVTGVATAMRRVSEDDLSAPSVVDAEVGSALRRMEASGALDTRLADAAVTDLADLELLRFDHPALLWRAWALRHTVTFADGLYVALAEQLDVPLVTLDARLAGAPGLRAAVEVLPRG